MDVYVNKMLILGTANNDNSVPKNISKGVFGISTIINTLFSNTSSSSSFIISFQLLKGNVRLLTMSNNDNINIGSLMSVKDYKKHLQLINSPDYFNKILLRKPAQYLNYISIDVDKELNWIDWLSNYFSI